VRQRGKKKERVGANKVHLLLLPFILDETQNFTYHLKYGRKKKSSTIILMYP
jgi:hypothetical protein